MLEKQPKSEAAKVTDVLWEVMSNSMKPTRERDLRNWVLMREYKIYITHVRKVLQALRERSQGD